MVKIFLDSSGLLMLSARMTLSQILQRFNQTVHEICSRGPARDEEHNIGSLQEVLEARRAKNKYTNLRRKDFFSKRQKTSFFSSLFGSLRPLRGHKIHEAQWSTPAYRLRSRTRVPGSAPAQRTTRSSEGHEDLAKNKTLPVPVSGLESGCGR